MRVPRSGAHRRGMSFISRPSISRPFARRARHRPNRTLPFRWLLHDLRLAWSLDPGTGQPTLRDYPLRRPGGGPR
jgi:hypothetical protein